MAGSTSDPERWRRVEEVLDQALELPAHEVAPFLDRACAGDPALRADIEGYLEADEKAGGFLEVPAARRAAGLLDEEGRELGPYRLLRRIGGGGMEVVYEAWDERLRRTVAVKLLPEAWSSDEKAKARFLREARAVSCPVDHPNICTIHDLGESDGRLFLVMTFYRGETLKERLDRGPLPPEVARDLAAQVARGLGSAHAVGIVHRDVKPANVMIVGREEGAGRASAGRAKILDFGIATIAGETALTQAGSSPGTPAYMSPEQTLGRPVDARSDLWSLGVVLYEMLTGRRPFRGEGAQAVIHGIQNRDPEPLDLDVPEDLARVVAKALAKAPEERFQSAAELLAELGAAPEADVWRKPSRWTAYGLAAAAAVLAASFATYRAGRTSAPVAPVEIAATAAAAAEAPRLAVLYFQNLTGDPELDWMRTGLTEMLVTDLSQASAFRVLSTSRLYQVLDQLQALEVPGPSFELIQELAERSGVETVVRGSYARLGDVFRIVYQVETAATGETLASSSVEGRGPESLFGMVDEVSAAVRRRFEGPAPAPRPATVSAVTTSSPEAWRLYSAGVELQYRSLYRESIALLEKAVEIDPDFALALSALGQLHRNRGHAVEAREYVRRAVERADRLPVNQRLSIQGAYYGNTWETMERGIEALEEAVRLYPDREPLRNNLAALYGFRERYEEAAAEYETLIRGGTSFAGTAVSAASVNAALGRFETGYEILSDFARRLPEDWYVRFGLGWLLTEWGKLDEAEASLAAAAGMRPGDVNVLHGEWRLRVLREDWPRAELEAAAMAALPDSFARWRGAVSQAQDLLFQGRSREARERLETSARAYAEPGAYTALSHCLEAELLLRTGDAGGALRAARKAQEEGREQWPELEGLFLEALAQEALGASSEADAAKRTLAARAAAGPNALEERQLRHLVGRLALAKGDTAGAVAALERAAALLPPRGVEFHRHARPDHVPVWFALGEAELAAGRAGKALAWFRKVASSGVEHVEFPVLYVRSFYFLGKIHGERGEEREARNAFERFLEHWETGDLDRRWVAEALAATRETRP